MKYLSVCSGIEAATMAWHDLGWKPAGFSEIEPFPSAVLAHHYPDVTNFGDMTKYKDWNLDGKIDLLVGGTPCQSFSVAGLRKGMDDPRGNLALVYCGMLDHFRPNWFVWENVPGVLSSSGGRDFGSFLGALAQLGYGFAYRVLDAQYCGVAQRRRRVFVVGHLGDWRPAAAVLFERSSLRRDLAPSQSPRENIASATPKSVGALCARDYKGVGNQYVSEGKCIVTTASGKQQFGTLMANAGTKQWLGNQEAFSGDYHILQKVYETHPADSRVKDMGETCQTVTSRWGTGGGNVPLVQEAYSLREDAKANTFSATPLKVTPALQALRPSVQSHHAQTFIAEPELRVRRLTPKECERLQGFPDNFTDIPWRKKDTSPDGLRYKALGNSMAVPVMQWIGDGIDLVDTL